LKQAPDQISRRLFGDGIIEGPLATVWNLREREILCERFAARTSGACGIRSVMKEVRDGDCEKSWKA